MNWWLAYAIAGVAHFVLTTVTGRMNGRKWWICIVGAAFWSVFWPLLWAAVLGVVVERQRIASIMRRHLRP